MSKYFIAYGCHLSISYEIVEAESAHEVLYYTSELAIKETERWVGSAEFCSSEELAGMDEDESNEFIKEAVETAATWAVELYNPHEHDKYLN